MRILLVHRYFWPDTPPYASMLRTIAEHLAANGHEVTVYTAQPSYGGSELHEELPNKEQIGPITVTRARLLDETPSQVVRRVVNLVLFSAQVSINIVRNGRYDVVMAATTPPVLVAFCARLASKQAGSSFIYHMQDIYPEVLAAEGTESLPARHRLLRRLDSVTTRKADRVVVLSKDMVDTLEKRHPTTNAHVINNFLPDKTHTTSEVSELARTSWRQASYQVVFAGNLGNFQGLDAVIDAFMLLSERSVNAHLVLLGSGVAEKDLKRRAASILGETVFFPGRVSQEHAEQVVSASDLALVTLNPGVIQAAFPSKTMTYLSCGTPVLAAVEPWSELAELLSTEEVGATCALEPGALSIAIESMVERSHEIDSASVNAVAERYASAASRVPQWAALFGDLSE